MSEHTELAELIAGNNDQPEDMWRQGVVTAIVGTTLTVRIGGATTAVAGIRYLASYASPAVNDVVHLLPYGKGYLVIGKLA